MLVDREGDGQDSWGGGDVGAVQSDNKILERLHESAGARLTDSRCDDENRNLLSIVRPELSKVGGQLS